MGLTPVGLFFDFFLMGLTPVGLFFDFFLMGLALGHVFFGFFLWFFTWLRRIYGDKIQKMVNLLF